MISINLLPAVYALPRGTPVARPLFFNFPGDEQGYNVAETEFMLGDSILVAPVLTEVSYFTFRLVHHLRDLPSILIVVILGYTLSTLTCQ